MRFSKRIDTPSSFSIYDSGFISPDGIPYSMGETTHGTWIKWYWEWLQQKGYNVPNFGNDTSIMSGKNSDELRDSLVRQGWIHVYAPNLLQVWKYDFKTEELIKRAYLNGDIVETGNMVQVVEASTGNEHDLNIKENVFASSKFSIREANLFPQPKTGPIVYGFISPEGTGYPMNGHDYHSQWICDNYEFIKDRYPDFPEQKELHYMTPETMRYELTRRGWLAVGMEYIIYVRNLFEQRQQIIDAILMGTINLPYKNKPVRVLDYSKDANNTHPYTCEELENFKGASNLNKIKLSSRDAIKDYINYWGKTKNKDFSKYWRLLRKKKRKK